MKFLLNNTLLWILAFMLTLGFARFQRKTGPTQPIKGKAEIGTTVFAYEIERTHGGLEDHPVRIEIEDSDVTGTVIWKRYKLDEPLRQISMQRVDDALIAYLPHQPPAGKLEYQVILSRGKEKLFLPEDEPAVIRFKGAVPIIVLLPHIILMFTGLFVGMRTALAALAGGKTRKLAWITLSLIVIGGLIFGPIVQKFAFGAFWTGWPLGEDWTDNKTAVMALAWALAVWRLHGRKGEKNGRWWTLVATVVTFAVYLIPHSMHGSELDYNSLSADSVEVRK